MNATRIVFASALYDLIVTAPFATPWTAQHSFGMLGRAHAALGLSGVVPSLSDPFALLFANLMGSIVVVWSVVRLLSPTPRLGAADTAGRALFSLWMAFALAHGASSILVGFLVLEIAWAIVQGAATLPLVAKRATKSW
ncbi:MAG: hypothetical protein ACXVEF_16505 [Polyangiales bacterium]